MKQHAPNHQPKSYTEQQLFLTASSLPAASHSSHSRSKMQLLLILLTYAVFITLLIAPLLQMCLGAFQGGWRAALASLSGPEALHALGVTVAVVAVVTVLNAIFGVWLSIVLVRGSWMNGRIRRLLNAIIDLPFAVSPIIGGFMIVLLLGLQLSDANTGMTSVLRTYSALGLAMLPPPPFPPPSISKSQ